MKSELKKIRRKIALDQQRAEEENRNRSAAKQVRWSLSNARRADNLMKANTTSKRTNFSKSPEE